MLRRLWVPACCLLLSGAIAGCGNSRTPAPSYAQPAAPRAFQLLSYRSAGVRFRAPRDWTVTPSTRPLVTVVSSGPAVVALWRYPRTVPPPATDAALAQALSHLIAAAKGRGAGFQLIRSAAVTIDKVRAVELDAFEKIGGQLRRVRSTHVFFPKAEVVLEEYAPPALFHAVDHAVFSPLKRSLAFSAQAAL